MIVTGPTSINITTCKGCEKLKSYDVCGSVNWYCCIPNVKDAKLIKNINNTPKWCPILLGEYDDSCGNIKGECYGGDYE